MMSPEQSGRERIFICERAVNLRKSFDGLSGVVEGIMEEDPEAGDLFVFFNRTRRLIKVLQWQGDGFAIWMKRLEQGSFHLPEPKGDRATESSRRNITNDIFERKTEFSRIFKQ